MTTIYKALLETVDQQNVERLVHPETGEEVDAVLFDLPAHLPDSEGCLRLVLFPGGRMELLNCDSEPLLAAATVPTPVLD